MNRRGYSSFNRIKILVAVTMLTVLAAVLLVPAESAGASEITSIDATTFRSNTDISTIHIGSNVTEISSGSFRGLMNLRSITVSEKNPYFASYSNCLYDKDLTELLCYPPALSGAIIPETVVSIRENALFGVPENIKSQIRDLVKTQAVGGRKEEDISDGTAHFIHTENGVRWMGANGIIRDPDTELMKLVANIIWTCTTADMTLDTQLQRCFDYMVRTSSYEKRIDVPLENWASGYAVDLLKNGKGGMYNFAAAFAYIAKGLGYDSRICTGYVMSDQNIRSGRVWTEVKIGDQWYIFDSSMQRLRGEGYYKQTYSGYPDGTLTSDGTFSVTY